MHKPIIKWLLECLFTSNIGISSINLIWKVIHITGDLPPIFLVSYAIYLEQNLKGVILNE